MSYLRVMQPKSRDSGILREFLKEFRNLREILKPIPTILIHDNQRKKRTKICTVYYQQRRARVIRGIEKQLELAPSRYDELNES